MKFRFTRFLKTGDSLDAYLSIGQNIYLNYGYSSTGGMTQHTS